MKHCARKITSLLLVFLFTALFACNGESTADDAGQEAGPDITDDRADTQDVEDTGEEFEPVRVGASGHAFNFGPPGGRVLNAEVRILEFPDLTTRTREEGAWQFDDLPGHTMVSFIMKHVDYPQIQTGTILLSDEDIERVSFQAPTWSLFDVLAGSVSVVPDPEMCQIATTVTRRGNSLYDATPGTHGEPGATVTSDPQIPAGHGPIYFNLHSYDVIYPDPDLTETTDDGGVLYVNVPPGVYVLTAHKEDTVFTDVTITCRPNVLVNASPPRGLQAVEGGVGPRE